jgi:hypothetical protein
VLFLLQTVSPEISVRAAAGISPSTDRVSVSSTGAQTNGGSRFASISRDGRFVAFQSSASNLVVGDTNGSIDIFVRDRLNGTTERVSVNTAGADTTERVGRTVRIPGNRRAVLDSLFRRLSAQTAGMSHSVV